MFGILSKCRKAYNSPQYSRENAWLLASLVQRWRASPYKGAVRSPYGGSVVSRGSSTGPPTVKW